jgi:hypothetical protein
MFFDNSPYKTFVELCKIRSLSSPDKNRDVSKRQNLLKPAGFDKLIPTKYLSVITCNDELGSPLVKHFFYSNIVIYA